MAFKINRDLGLGLAAAFVGVAAAFLPPSKVVAVSQETIALFGMLLAGALPAMILTATILRAGAFSPKRIGEYAEALDRQLSFWFYLFIWALLACIFITISKSLWDEKNPVSFMVKGVSINGVKFEGAKIYGSSVANFFAAFAGTQVCMRLFPMLTGLRSLLRLNSQIAKEEAVARTLETKSAVPSQIAKMRPPSGHGSTID